MEGLKAQAGEVIALPKKGLKSVTSQPLVLVGVVFFSLVLVLLIEAYKPGVITTPIRRMLRAIGVKTA